MTHEILLIKSFVKKDRQERYLKLVNTPKGRIKFRQKIAHFSDLEISYLRKISPSDQNRSYIIDQLKKYNAPSICYIIAEHSKYDQKSMILEDAFDNLFGSGLSFFISCIP